MTFGKAIKEQRIKKGLTQAQLAEMLGKAESTLTLPMPKGRGFSVLPSQPCICKVLYKVPERSVRACPALP